MSSDSIVRILSLAILASCTLAGPARFVQPKTAEELFKAIDTNADNFLSIEEATKQGLSLTVVQEVFELADENKDALISFPEFEAYGGKVRNRNKAEDERKMAAAATSLLTLVDLDGNGKVSIEELRVFAGQFGGSASNKTSKLFEAVDTNQDGQLDGSELSDAHEKVAGLLQEALIPTSG